MIVGRAANVRLECSIGESLPVGRLLEWAALNHCKLVNDLNGAAKNSLLFAYW